MHGDEAASCQRQRWEADGVHTNKRRDGGRDLQLRPQRTNHVFHNPRWVSDEAQSHKERWTPNGLCYVLSVIPAVVLTYIQLTLNLVMVAVILIATTRFLSILGKDLEKHINVQENRMLATIIECSREYYRNKCAALDLPPALEKTCDVWRQCMEQETGHIMKSKETAVVLAEILNNFFGSLSDRTIYCSGGLLIGSVLLANMVLMWSRRLTVRV